MSPHYRDIAFLLPLGALPLACKDSDPADDDTTAPDPLNHTSAAPAPTCRGSSPRC